MRQTKTTFSGPSKRYWVGYTPAKQGGRFHTVGKCLNPLSVVNMTLSTLRTLGYKPCGRCKPLQ